jgi:hypothetical protein
LKNDHQNRPLPTTILANSEIWPIQIIILSLLEKPLSEAFSLSDGMLYSCVIDLPFLVRGYGSRISERFTSFNSEDEMYSANREMIELAFQKLRKGGYLVMKTMDASLWPKATLGK